MCVYIYIYIYVCVCVLLPRYLMIKQVLTDGLFKKSFTIRVLNTVLYIGISGRLSIELDSSNASSVQPLPLNKWVGLMDALC